MANLSQKFTIFATIILINSLETIDSKIVRKMSRAGRGAVFFAEDFMTFGSSKAVAKALERLVKKNTISRVGRGIYSRLAIDPVLGPVQPSTEDIARAIKRRDKARIMATGVQALNAMGLSTQVPLNVVYLTDGSARTIKMGKRKIVFKKASPKNLAAIGKDSGLAIQAMKELGKEKITEEEIDIILNNLPVKSLIGLSMTSAWRRSGSESS